MRLLAILVLFSLLAFVRGAGTSTFQEPPTTLPEAVTFMKSADSARIFVVDANGQPGSYARNLDKAAARQLAALLTRRREAIFPPMGMPIPPPEVGIEFQKGQRKFTLYTQWDFRLFYDHFQKAGDGQGMVFLAVLGEKEGQLAQQWQQKYFPKPVYSP